MSESDIQVILSKLETLSGELQEFKKNIKDDLTMIRQEAKEKCTSCLNFSLLKQTVETYTKNTDSNIKALWGFVVSVATILLGAYIQHIWVK